MIGRYSLGKDFICGFFCAEYQSNKALGKNSRSKSKLHPPFGKAGRDRTLPVPGKKRKRGVKL
jgi:hypothetical protein